MYSKQESKQGTRLGVREDSGALCPGPGGSAVGPEREVAARDATDNVPQGTPVSSRPLLLRERARETR